MKNVFSFAFLQEKYRRDQEKLEEEFRKAQQEAVTEGTKQYQEVSSIVKRIHSVYLSKKLEMLEMSSMVKIINNKIIYKIYD